MRLCLTIKSWFDTPSQTKLVELIVNVIHVYLYGYNQFQIFIRVLYIINVYIV